MTVPQSRGDGNPVRQAPGSKFRSGGAVFALARACRIGACMAGLPIDTVVLPGSQHPPPDTIDGTDTGP